MDSERQQIEECLQRIEAKVGWGAAAGWQNQDFEALSARIFKETKVSLSVSTLKRLWGKVRYEGSPNLTTLNALAQFVGYENWRAFISNGSGHPLNGAAPRKEGTFTLPKIPRAILIIAAAGISAVLFLLMQNRPKLLEYENIAFSSQPVANQVPNTVVFNYNAKDSNADSVFIQQSWDPMRRYRVDKTLTEFTSTYYLPGYYRAKLILDTTIVAEHDIFIETSGWLATIDRNPVPVYAGEDLILSDGIVRVADTFFSEYKVDFEKEKMSTSFHRVMKEEVLPDSAFQLDVTLKNTFAKGALVCQKTQIMLIGVSEVIIIPLSIKGCVGELFLMAGEPHDGMTNDLSAFGVDFSDWVTVRCRVKDKKITILVNEAPAFEGPYQGTSRIVGTRISFMGTGEVKAFRLKKI